ncbi:MAG TPA: toprim domain-containing protein, partial [Candidatus Acidoferrales bacterium]|nr:toprim domain-containing protein [Candidatus Acidoferrales bacterium]
TKRGQAVLMEGQFDVIVGHQYGVRNAVASSGTALTEDQVRLLKRFTEEVVIALDGDAAGKSATQKVVEVSSALGLRTRVVDLAGAKDPDEFLRAAGERAAERWAELEAGASEGWESLIRDAVGPGVGDPSRLNAALVRVRGVLARIPDQPLQERNLELAAGLLGTEPHRLRLKPGPEPSAKPSLGPPPDGKKLTVGRYLLQLLAVRPEAIGRLRGRLQAEELDEEDRATYQRLMDTIERGGLKALEEELPDYPEADQSFVRRAWASPPPSVEDDTADDLVRQLKLRRIRTRQSAIIRGLAEAERRGDSAQVSSLEADLNQVLRELQGMEEKGR